MRSYRRSFFLPPRSMYSRAVVAASIAAARCVDRGFSVRTMGALRAMSASTSWAAGGLSSVGAGRGFAAGFLGAAAGVGAARGARGAGFDCGFFAAGGARGFAFAAGFAFADGFAAGGAAAGRLARDADMPGSVKLMTSLVPSSNFTVARVSSSVPDGARVVHAVGEAHGDARAGRRRRGRRRRAPRRAGRLRALRGPGGGSAASESLPSVAMGIAADFAARFAADLRARFAGFGAADGADAAALPVQLDGGRRATRAEALRDGGPLVRTELSDQCLQLGLLIWRPTPSLRRLRAGSFVSALGRHWPCRFGFGLSGLGLVG